MQVGQQSYRRPRCSRAQSGHQGTHHYYFRGPATNPDVNIPNLLKPATMQKVQTTASLATAAAGKIGARVRMTEGNTCYRGGKPGVSDVFAAALWAADYSLT
jgi:hypothetical protein